MEEVDTLVMECGRIRVYDTGCTCLEGETKSFVENFRDVIVCRNGGGYVLKMSIYYLIMLSVGLLMYLGEEVVECLFSSLIFICSARVYLAVITCVAMLSYRDVTIDARVEIKVVLCSSIR